MTRRFVPQDFDQASAWAGITGFVWYAFGAVPLQIAVSQQLELTATQTSSWIFIVWFTGATSSLILSLTHRKPIPLTWTIPGLVYLGTLAGKFTIAELVGANLIAGLLILALALAGVGQRIMRWLPLPIVMGMFGGSVLGYATRMVEATVADGVVAGVTVAAYVVGRALGKPRVPPVGLAVLAGGLAAVLAGRWGTAAVTWSFPTIAVAPMRFTFSAALAVSLPMVVLALGLGNVQGLGFLFAQGYRVPVNRVTVVVGINSILNALLGGHAATVSRVGVAILAGPEAGPKDGRYWATVVAAVLTLGMAVAAVPVASLLNILPVSYLVALAGVAIFAALQDAFERSFGGPLRFGPAVAFVVAATPFAFAGITSAFWALVAGVFGSILVDRKALAEYLRAAATGASSQE